MIRIAIAIVLATVGNAAQANESLRVGQTSGPHETIMEQVREVARDEGLDIELVSFSDFIMPNAALDDGSIDANSYQTQAFLDAQKQARGYPLIAVAKTVLFPMGIYSHRVETLDALPQGASIGLPNDPANVDRSLRLLEHAGLITLNPTGGPITEQDVAQNPRALRFVALDAAQLTRSLDDLDAAAINTSYALKAGIDPASDALAREGLDSPHANLLVVREADRDEPWVAQLIRAYHSDRIRAFIEEEFKGAAVPAF
ncbi:MetQ/NlpA family ABC transporter substrate-binding protein [Halotalea alkalilenta]|uniref:Metal ABC transporter substrate-binding protein n=1 Tax=Halotalea alkalilenta TaxID=376489 RepID=A0A172YDG4_9GAMM|nr:MetQ/NlpA family ABC transporter substrate-binding protein [Halotalea alkalilenta]ANF57278.1 metal ABC transporter substrate-binding protein [Halotalea alkalilenta]